VGETLALYTPTAESLLGHLPDALQRIVTSIGETGMAVAAIIGLVLDNLIPGTPAQRGLGPGVLVPEAGDIGEGEE
jgi:xanthine/uracil permease